MTPNATDIAKAIDKAESGDWIDPDEVAVYWLCDLYDPARRKAGDGCGDTAEEAMALAWLCARAPDALTEAYVEPGTVPFNVPDGWCFELTPPAELAPADICCLPT